MTEVDVEQEESIELSQHYIDSQDKRAKNKMNHALQHLVATPIKWGIGGFMLHSAAEHMDLVIAVIGGGIVVWGAGDIGKGINQLIGARDITKQVTSLRAALTRKLID